MDNDPLLDRLCAALDKQQRQLAEYENWYDGDHPIPHPPANTAAEVDAAARKAYQRMAELGITNFIPPIVDAPSDRLSLEGFRLSDSGVDTDADAWSIWARNGLDDDFGVAIRTALKVGKSYIMVWPDSEGRAEVTLEDPEQTIVAYAAGSRRIRAAALKRWRDDDGHVMATVYTPDWIYKYRSKAPATLLTIPGIRTEWEMREVPGETWPLHNPLGAVPIVEVAANPGIKAATYGDGKPEFLRQITTQRRLNKNTFDLLTTAEAQSFRQRWATDWDPPTKLDADGNVDVDRAAIMRMSASRTLIFNNADPTDERTPRVGEFAQAELHPFTTIWSTYVKEMAAVSATPPWAFLIGSDMVNVASDSVARVESSFVSKVGRHSRRFGAAASEVVRLALLAEGNDRAKDPGITAVWAEFEARSASEQMELALGAHELGAPLEFVFSQIPGVTAAKARLWAQDRRTTDLASWLTGTDAITD